MAYTTPSDLFDPEILIPVAAERLSKNNHLLGSPVVVHDGEPENTIGEGTVTTIPFYLPPTLAHSVLNPGTAITPARIVSKF